MDGSPTQTATGTPPTTLICSSIRIPGMRRKAIRRPSADHAGEESRSTLGAIQVTFRPARSSTPTKPWSPRLLTNARRVPSGEKTRPPRPPRAFKIVDGSPASPPSPPSPPASFFSLGGSSRRSKISPPRAQTTRSPEGESTGPPPAATFHGSPPAVRTAQIARSAPSGSLVGLAISPATLGWLPRT